jgi:hypothetical protein
VSGTWALLPVIDGFMATVTAIGMTKDATGTLPAEYKPDTIYAGPVSQTQRLTSTSTEGEVWFNFRVAWSASNKGEDGGKLRLRTVSDAVDNGVVTISAAVLANPGHVGLWDWLQVSQVVHDAFGQFNCRGAYIDLTGYRVINT